MQTREARAPAPPAQAEEALSTAGGRRASGTAVRKAARSLLSRSWSSAVTSTDPRLGEAVAQLHPEAEDARHASQLLTEGGFHPDEAHLKVDQLNDFAAHAERLQRMSLEQELDDLAALTAPRAESREMLKARLGFSGEEPVTLQVAGDLIGVTRERARQVEHRFRTEVCDPGPVWTPVLDLAVEIVEKTIPAPGAEVVSGLRGAGVVESDFGLGALVRVAELFQIEPAFGFDRDLDLVVPAGDLLPVVKIRSAARRLIEHQGVARMGDAVVSIGGDDPRMDPKSIALVLEALDGFEWLDREHGWFWIEGVQRNRILNLISKILSVVGDISVVELGVGIGRTHRMRGFHVPASVLLALCDRNDLCTVRGDRVIGSAELPDWRILFGDAERVVVEVLFEHGPVMRRADLQRICCEDLGMNRNSFGVYLSYSPVIERYAPALFGLRGVSPKIVQSLVAAG